MSFTPYSKPDLGAEQPHRKLDNPVIIIGMPRSGSTIFTRLLNVKSRSSSSE